MSRAAESEQGNSRCLAHEFPRLELWRISADGLCLGETKRKTQVSERQSVDALASLRMDHFALRYALAGCASHCAPLHFAEVLVLSVSPASPTPSFIGSTLWVFYRSALPFSRIGQLDIFRSPSYVPLLVPQFLCVRATRTGCAPLGEFLCADVSRRSGGLGRGVSLGLEAVSRVVAS